jgi:hypothetical protein
MVQAAESRQGSNLAFSPRRSCWWPTLKTVLAPRRVAPNAWKPAVDLLMKDSELSPQIHAQLQHLYDDIAEARDEAAALEALLIALMQNRTWN